MRFSVGLLVALLHSFDHVRAFGTTLRPALSTSIPVRHTERFMASGKGFGEASKKKTTVPETKLDETLADSSAVSQTSQPAASTTTTDEQQPTTRNAGQVALERMRRLKAEEQEAELRSVRELMLQDKLAKETPAVIPEKVAQRMGRRMLPFVGLPLFAAMGTFVGFWYFATYKNMEFQPAAVATTTVFLLFVGLLGITYSLLSASWDPEREGNILGVDEFKTNIDSIRAGLNRSRENVLLREKMAGLSESEMQAALNELERREKAEAKRNQSLASKLKDDLE